MLIFKQKISNYVSSDLKLHNLYCHTAVIPIGVSWDATGKQASSGLTLWGTRSFQERTRTKQVFKNKAKIIINKGQESQFSQNVGGPGALGRGLSGNVGHDDCFDICSHLLLCYAHLPFFTKEKRERRGNEFIRYFYQSRNPNQRIFQWTLIMISISTGKLREKKHGLDE